MEYADLLELTPEAFDSLADHLQESRFEGTRYRHLPDHRQSIEKGTVLIEDAIVRGFPKIPRALVLEAGITQHFNDEVAIEEKLNGYNVRIAAINDTSYAFTRSGLICPYTTVELRRRLPLEDFFGDHPERMLCGEMIGPENPYTPHEYAEVDSIAFRAFDIRERTSGKPLPVERRREICTAYDIDQTELFGIYPSHEASDAVQTIIADLDKRGREGVVMKAPTGGNELKYTTFASTVGDLAFAFSLPFDYGKSFMFRRLVRAAFQTYEFDPDATTRAQLANDLGEAILNPMVEAIEQVDDGEDVGERHTIRGDPAAIEGLFSHFRNQGLDLRIEEDRQVEGERVVTFQKRIQRTNDKIQNYLDGQVVDI